MKTPSQHQLAIAAKLPNISLQLSLGHRTWWSINIKDQGCCYVLVRSAESLWEALEERNTVYRATGWIPNALYRRRTLRLDTEESYFTAYDDYCTVRVRDLQYGCIRNKYFSYDKHSTPSAAKRTALAYRDANLEAYDALCTRYHELLRPSVLLVADEELLRKAPLFDQLHANLGSFWKASFDQLYPNNLADSRDPNSGYRRRYVA
jgi:hypothetical protein